MPNIKITQLPELAPTPLAGSDVFPVVSGNITYQVTANAIATFVGGGGANTGNVTFDNNIVIGTGDGFGGDGLYLAVGPSTVGDAQLLRLRGGDFPTHIHLDTGNNAYYDQYFGDDGKYVKLEAGDNGNIVIGTNNLAWTFDNTGNLNLPNNGDLKLNNGGIVQSNGDDIAIQAFDNDGILSSSVELDPSSELTRIEQWSGQQSTTFTTADWATGTYTTQGGQGAVEFTNAANIITFVNSLNGVGQIFFSVNGGPKLVWDGTGGDATNITFYTLTLPATDPTTVTSFEYFYSYKSGFEIDYDSQEVNIYANNADIRLITGDLKDIELSSARHMVMSGSGEVGITNYSNADGVYINTNANSTLKQWLFDETGGLNLATVNSESAQLFGTRKVIGGLALSSPYSVALAPGGTPTVAYTASSSTIQSVKITFAVQSGGGGFQWEQFDVVATQDQGGGVNYIVSNRVKSAAGIADTAVTAAINVDGQLEISLDLAAVQTSGGASSFDAIEFGLMID
jgi:hypothetical protein